MRCLYGVDVFVIYNHNYSWSLNLILWKFVIECYEYIQFDYFLLCATPAVNIVKGGILNYICWNKRYVPKVGENVVDLVDQTCWACNGHDRRLDIPPLSFDHDTNDVIWSWVHSLELLFLLTFLRGCCGCCEEIRWLTKLKEV